FDRADSPDLVGFVSLLCFFAGFGESRGLGDVFSGRLGDILGELLRFSHRLGFGLVGVLAFGLLFGLGLGLLRVLVFGLLNLVLGLGLLLGDTGGNLGFVFVFVVAGHLRRCDHTRRGSHGGQLLGHLFDRRFLGGRPGFRFDRSVSA